MLLLVFTTVHRETATEKRADFLIALYIVRLRVGIPKHVSGSKYLMTHSMSLMAHSRHLNKHLLPLLFS